MRNPNSGDVSQLSNIRARVEVFSSPNGYKTTPNPRMDPTIEWVVDTGREKYVAKASQQNVPSKVQNITITYKGIFWLMVSGLTSPLLIVCATSPPIRDPRNSNKPPMKMACLMLIALDPTHVPSAFDTSWAPMAHAIRKPVSPLRYNSSSPIQVASIGFQKGGGEGRKADFAGRVWR
mmetsp:Transcript_26626/g.47178  ORF Transcript_26626/g.47178 Transcript_26626/m.47178 type:complete len:178 (+) Transcript_26626:506-1039(+)